MAGEIQLNSTTMATESSGTITLSNVNSATNRQNLGLEIGVDVQSFDADTTKNDVANTFTANQIISVTDNTNAALRVTQLGTGNALVVEDSTNPDSTPFVVDASGNVGIGAGSPQDGLDVAKNARIGQGQISADSTVGVLGIYGGLTTSSTNSQLRFFGKSVSNTGLTYEIARISGSSFGPYSLSGGIQFSTASNDGANNLTLTERMRIDSSGNVLIDYTSSNGSYKLQVNSQIFATSSTIATSDGRYKENIQPLDSGLAIVQALNPVQFDWKEHPVHQFDREQPTVGFIAQEVQEVLVNKAYKNSIIKNNTTVITPEELDEHGNVITAEVTEEFLGIAEGNLIAILTKAIQEQQTLIESQQFQIDALTARIEALETT